MTVTHINVGQGKENGIGQEDTAGLLVDGGGNDIWVHSDGAVPASKLTTEFYGCVFGTEESTQTFVNYENQLC